MQGPYKQEHIYMFIRSKKFNDWEFNPTITQSKDEVQALENQDGLQRYYDFDDKSWAAILEIVEEMAPLILKHFPEEVQRKIHGFIAWLAEKTESSRHIPYEESIGLHACLWILQPFAADHSTYMARDMGFLMQVIEVNEDGVHYVLDMDELGLSAKTLGKTKMTYYESSNTDTDA